MISIMVGYARSFFAFWTMIIFGLLGYPWLWFSGERRQREYDRLERMEQRILRR